MTTTNNIEDFFTFCKNHIINNLPDHEGENVYMCDLGIDLTQAINCDGSFTYSRALAMDYLREWWDEAAQYWEYEKMNFGENIHNPFDNPEAYTVCMVIEGVNALLSRCAFVDDNWNDQITLTKEDIETILAQLEELDESEDIF